MAHPDGTRAWRKAHRKRWRDGSSYRGLTLLQRVFLHWVEENADDEGRTQPTGQHYLAKLFSSPREAVTRDQIQRAAAALEKLGLLNRVPHIDPHKQPHKQPHKTATIYVRVKFAEYQLPGAEPHKEPHKQSSVEPLPGSREQLVVVAAAAPQSTGRWPLGEQLRRLVGQGLCIIGPGGDGLKPPTCAEERDRLEADLAKVGVEAAAASCIESAKRSGKGGGISSLRYFLAHVHDIAQPASALPEQRRGKPSCTAPAEVHTFTGEVAF